MRLRLLATLAAAGALAAPAGALLSGCGSSSSTSTTPLVVSAAASLRLALTTYGAAFGPVTATYGGSDQLAAQIRAGARPDVFAAANSSIPDALYAEHLVEQPVKFATNTLVLAVPVHSHTIHTLADVMTPGTKLVVGSDTVPVGSYTDTALARLGAEGTAISAQIVSREPSVDGIVGKLLTGAADAGFLYITDVRGAKGQLKAIRLPADARPSVVYEAAVVSGTAQRATARRYIVGLLSGDGRAALSAAGFGAPPSGS